MYGGTSIVVTALQAWKRRLGQRYSMLIALDISLLLPHVAILKAAGGALRAKQSTWSALALATQTRTTGKSRHCDMRNV